MNWRVARFGKLGRFALPYLGLLVTGAVMAAGATALVEMIYHIQLDAGQGPKLRFLGVELDTQGTGSWVGAGLLFAVGLALLEIARRRFARLWSLTQEEIEAVMRQRGA
jgi:branched-chain amino acid transport system permease protein